MIDRLCPPSFDKQNRPLNPIVIFEASAAAAGFGAKISPVAQIVQPD